MFLVGLILPFFDELTRLYYCQFLELLVASQRLYLSLVRFHFGLSLFLPCPVVATIAHASAEIRPFNMPALDLLILFLKVYILFIASFAQAFRVVLFFEMRALGGLLALHKV